MDLELVKGQCKGGCSFCYKGNGSQMTPHYMDLATYKKFLDTMPENLLQVAFGITDIDGCPDFFEIMEYTKSKGIIPNYTTHGLDITPEIAARTASLCGAVAVSIVNKEASYNAIKLFTDAGMDQVNIHYMISEESYHKAFTIMQDIQQDPRLAKMNAIVFLSLKQKGRGCSHTNLSAEKYKKLVDYALTHNIRIGFDSCSAPLFLQAVQNSPDFEYYKKISEPCESLLFSIYADCHGNVTPCSFLEGEGYKSFNVLECEDFMKDIWFAPETVEWRKKLTETEKKCKLGCRMCPHYNIYNKELLNEN